MEVHPELINSIDLSVDEVHQELVNLQKDKAGGPNCVPAYLPQIVADFLAASLSKLFQLSFSTRSLPRDWVTAILTLYQFIKKVIVIFHPTTAQLV